MATERTPLRTGGPPAGPGAYDQAPTYVFMTNPGRAHRNKIRQFQCCVCAAILGVFVMALIITVSYSVEHDDLDNENATTPMPPPIPPVNGSLKLLLTSSWPKPDAASPPWPGPEPDAAALKQAMQSAHDELGARAALEAKMTPLQPDTPSYRANQAVHTRPEATTLAQRALLEEKATKKLLHESGRKLSWRSSAGRGPRLHAAAAPGPEEAACAEDELAMPCPATPYRSADGSCNNVKHPRTWGVAMRPFRRAMPPAYMDGVSQPRGVAQGLPSAREVSLGVHRPLYRNDPDFTVMLAVWGQFLDHDITATALSQAADGSAISCCDLPPEEQHPECFPVRLAAGDPYYHKYNVTCMEFVRSAPAPTCSLGQREQLNQASSFIDASVVYGPTSALMRSLREEPSPAAAAVSADEDGDSAGGAARPALGRLRMSMSPDGRELLPVSEDPMDGCNRQEMNDRGRYCFKSGDGRANENLHLTTMHLLWARQHNRVAASLQRLNPHWNDERVFQESRRIVAAQMQHVTYKEFLPVILGPHVMAQLDLNPKEAGYDSSYDPDVDPTVCNSFAASSFRFAHTLLPGLLKLIGNDTSSPEYMELHQMLFDPYSLYSREGADRALRGAMDTSIERADSYFNTEVTQKLFAPRSIGRGSSGTPACGLDLVSLNVQRGRDHGLQPYPAWREHCGFTRPASWDDLDGVVDGESLQRMKEIYKSLDDVDVYTGALSEYPVEGGLLGGTLTCLLADQFVRLKRGDRYWYETNQQPQAFTPAQLAEIRKASLASVICGTSDGVHSAQPEVMRRAKGSQGGAKANQRVACAQLPRTNLRAWMERDARYVYHRADALRATDRAPQDHDDVPDSLVLVGTTADDAGLKPSTARAVRVGGRVTAGSITTSSGASLWSGAVPTAIPIPMKAAGTFLSGGVQWDGSLVLSGASATVKGTFTVDAFTAGAGAPPQPSGKTAGRFDVTMDVLWDSSADGVIDLSGTFRSPIYLRTKDGKGSAPLVNAKGGSGPLSPVILHGEHDANGTAFLWNGNVTLVLPTMAQDDMAVEEAAPALQQAAYSGVTAPTTNVRVVAEVLSGSVTAQPEGGAQVTWWDGALPVTIPTSPFDARDDGNAAADPSGLAKPAARVDGVLWAAKVAASSPTTAQVSGTFKVPRFVHGNYSSAGVRVEWWSGSFALNVRLLGRVDDEVDGGLEGLLVPGQSYTSRLVFQSEKASSAASAAAPSAPLSLMAAAQEVVDGALPAPVILKGALSADGASFTWSGQAVLVIPRPAAERPAVQLLGQAPKKAVYAAQPSAQPEVRLVAMAKSGSVTAARDDGSSGETTVWSGTLPAAIPLPLFDAKSTVAPSPSVADNDGSPLYAHGVVWRGSLVTSGTTATLRGTFTVPRYLHAPRSDNTTGFAIEWWKGSFSLELEQQWASAALDGAVDPSASYSSPVFLKGASKAGAADDGAGSTSSPQRTPLAAFVAASMEQSEGALRAPLILQGTYSADGSTFYWSGGLVLALPRPAPALMLQSAPVQATKLAATAAAKPAPVRRIGIRVTSGNMYAYPEGAWFWRNWWSGSLPAAIPVPLFDSYKSDYAPYPSGPLFHACGVDWTGSITATGPTRAKIEGKFSMPRYQHGPGGVDITWYYGTFLFEGDLLWNASLAGLDGLSAASFSSHLYFKSQKPLPISKYPVRSAGQTQAASLQQFVADSVQAMDGAIPVPIVLDGTYSDDRHTFYWSGDAVITVPEPVRPPLMLQGKKPSKTVEKDDGTPSKPAKPAKPAKPVKPPKLRIAAMVTGGSVNASYDNSSVVELWSGAVPMWLPNPLFGMSSWDLDPTIKWSGKLTVLDSSGKLLRLDGTFTAPYLEQAGDDVVRHEWKGTFSVELRNLYSAVTQPELLKPGNVYSSRVVFAPAKTSAGGEVSAPQLVLTADGSDEKLAVIVLQGQYWFWSKSWWWWNGMASMGVPLDDDATDPNAYVKPDYSANKKLMSSGMKAAPAANKVAVAVVEGKVTAQREDDAGPAATWWSGQLPVDIPASPFDGVATNESTPFNRSAVVPGGVTRGVTWTGSLRPLTDAGDNGDAQLEGSFRFPKFLHPSAAGGSFSMEWWTGQFSLRLRPLAGSSLAGILAQKATYSSPIVFKAMASNDTITSLLKQDGDQDVDVVFVMASDAAAAGASKLTVLLQGDFSADKATFSWTGNAVLVLPPAAPGKKMRPLKLTASAPKKASASKKASGSSVGSKIGAMVTSGSVSAGKMGETASPWWAGTVPVSLPAGKPASILWSGTLSASSATTASISGTFTTALPEDSANGTTLVWWSGVFSLQLQLLWNASLSGCIRPGVKYVTPLYYRSEKLAPQLPQQVASLGQQMASGGEQVQAFLDGTYTLDKTAFLWSGKVFLTLPKTCGTAPSARPAAPLQLKAAPGAASSGGRVTAGAVVSSGWVTPSLWSGGLPVAVPAAAIRSLRPLTWRGSLSRGYGGTVYVKGSYAAPQYQHDAGGLTVDWLTGDFSFTARLLWDTGAVLDGALTGVANYTSAIYLQNSDSLRALEDVQDSVPAVWDRMMDKAVGGAAAEGKKVPIVLQGQFSEDGVTFLWSGGVLVGLPVAAWGA
ncbi:Chorion peroxidase [Frankliniella fusca]|uniref:Chorion peroxidase n=1 Tax=Frankliniella fusca TaxID=407009 RepID=A0AAE1GTD1_9NEOP|nr:Chorion peroxidase [Frankliniella fusca]